MTAIHFCKMPFLDMNYQNVIDFSSEEQRLAYFEGRNPLTVEGNIKYDGERTSISVNKPIGDLYIYDYLYFMDHSSESGRRKRYFYFITNLEMKTKTNTIVHLKLDVWTTYYFDYQINPSFVERMHVDRWKTNSAGELMPTGNQQEDEGLFYGEQVITGKEELCTINKSIVIASSTPMGYVPNFKPMGGGGDATSGGSYTGGGDWENGVISAKCFRFLKGYEGFSPYEYQDSGGYWTIGYGITKHGEADKYAQLAAQQPCSEEAAAKMLFEVINERYGKPIVSAVKSMGCNSQAQFDGLVSVAYNAGTGSVTGGNSLTNAISSNPTSESTIRPVWEKFKCTSNGSYLEGLHLRRIQECNMYFNQEVEMRSIPTLNSSGGISGTVTENNGDGWMPTDKSGDVMDVDGYKSFSNSLGDGFLCPVKGGTVSSVWGYRTHPITGERKLHNGTDISAPAGTPQVASKSGTVSKKGFHDSMGNYIYIDLDDGNQLRLMHFKEPTTLNVGDKVTRGQVVGYTGTTGGSTGNHCHWELRNADRESVNPAPSLKKGDRV